MSLDGKVEAVRCEVRNVHGAIGKRGRHRVDEERLHLNGEVLGMEARLRSEVVNQLLVLQSRLADVRKICLAQCRALAHDFVHGATVANFNQS